MDRNSAITTAFVSFCVAAVVMTGAKSCADNAKENTNADTKRMSECVAAGGSWVNGYSAGQCINSKD